MFIDKVSNTNVQWLGFVFKCNDTQRKKKRFYGQGTFQPNNKRNVSILLIDFISPFK
jgi:hypothetical protein